MIDLPTWDIDMKNIVEFFGYQWDKIFIGIYPLCFYILWCEQQVMYVIFTCWKIPNVWL